MGRLFKDRTSFLRDNGAYTAQLSIFRALTMFGDGKHVYGAENTVVQQTLFRLSNFVFPSNVLHRMKKTRFLSSAAFFRRQKTLRMKHNSSLRVFCPLVLPENKTCGKWSFIRWQKKAIKRQRAPNSIFLEFFAGKLKRTAAPFSLQIPSSAVRPARAFPFPQKSVHLTRNKPLCYTRENCGGE